MLTSLYLLAFGFTNLWMLGWLGAAAAPILIHLWNKRKYREVSWAAMEYLLAALRKNSRRLRIEQLLLLIVRTLIILLIVGAVAQPFLESAGLSFVGTERTLKVLVLDGSYSMAYKPTDKSRFDRAREYATQVIDESKQGDAFALVLMAEPPQVIIGTPAMEVRSVQDEIENLRVTHGGADLLATLGRIEQILAAPEANDLPRKEVYFFTDLGRTTWSADAEGNDSAGGEADARRRFEQLSSQAALIAVDLGQDASENLAIRAATVRQPFVLAARDAEIEVEVQNFGRQPRSGQVLELFADGRRVGQTKVDIPAGGQATASFQHRWEVPGEYAVEVRLASDLLDIDNHRYLTLPVKRAIEVLVVDGKPGSGQFTGAGDYVALALSPEQADTSGNAAIDVRKISESLLQEQELGRYDCVFLCNVGQFTGSEALMLENYLKQGGGLVFFLGDRVVPERYNQELAAATGPHVLPAKLLEASSDGQYRFDPLDYRHPLVSPFKGSEQAGLVTTPIFKYIRLEIPKAESPNGSEASAAKIALAFDNGDPAIVESPLHRGRSIVVATDGSLSSIADPASKTPWTTMAAWPSFVPIVQELLTWSVTRPGADRGVIVGEPIGGELPHASASQNVAINTPDNRQQSVTAEADAAGIRWSYSDTDLSGVYSVAASTEPAASTTAAPSDRLFSVNVDTREGDLSRIDASDLPPQFVTSERSDLDETAATAVARHTGMHRSLLYLVLGLLLFESILAWRFGNAGK